MPDKPRSIELLESIDASLQRLVLLLTPKTVAPDADLDGPHGNPAIHAKDPRDWHGPPMAGRLMSMCPPAYLDLLADRSDYFAAQAEAKNELHNGKPVAPYKRRDAARARGWAKRLREGWGPAQAPPGGGQGPSDADEDENPFAPESRQEDIPFR